ncbi:hypothetical protein F383_38518 [Gossypium arboreum]|uniref:Uncharacterized protein n=1 Tax=Gossypium arboreum TaxID=29729 RepID=A0A0B0MGE0_GOSAR|nr:hypothetical protein F383_38518 [Gossypium arboreum]
MTKSARPFPGFQFHNYSNHTISKTLILLSCRHGATFNVVATFLCVLINQIFVPFLD